MDHAIGLNILNVANTILGQTTKNGQNITLPLIQFAAAATNQFSITTVVFKATLLGPRAILYKIGHEQAWRSAVKSQRREREIVGSEEKRRYQRWVNGGMGGHRQHTGGRKGGVS